MDGFEGFWQAYPRKIAKGAARLEFARAIKKTTLDVIMAAVEEYKKHKPDHYDWAHPRTWLHQERWMDQWEEPVTIKPEPIMRPVRTVEEIKAYLADIGKALSPEIARAKSVEDLPVFARMVPANWRAS